MTIIYPSTITKDIDENNIIISDFKNTCYIFHTVSRAGKAVCQKLIKADVRFFYQWLRFL